MANFTYVLMVADLGSGIDRQRMDDALAGRVTIDLSDDDRIAPIPQSPDEIGPIIPRARNMEELREQWGRQPSAIREKLLFDRAIEQAPRQKPGTN